MADFEKYDAGRGTSDATVQTAWSNAHAGFIAQNVYLFAASEALASWFRAMVDAGALSRLLSLRASEKGSPVRPGDIQRKRNAGRDRLPCVQAPAVAFRTVLTYIGIRP